MFTWATMFATVFAYVVTDNWDTEHRADRTGFDAAVAEGADASAGRTYYEKMRDPPREADRYTWLMAAAFYAPVHQVPATENEQTRGPRHRSVLKAEES